MKKTDAQLQGEAVAAMLRKKREEVGMTKEEFTKKMLEIAEKCDTDNERYHAAADGLISTFLRQLGYVEAMDAYDKMETWYA